MQLKICVFGYKSELWKSVETEGWSKSGNELYPFIVCAERPLLLSGTFIRSGALFHRTSSSGVHHSLETDREGADGQTRLS